MMLVRSTTALAAITMCTVVASGATITGSFGASGDPISLTAAGDLDWVHWVRLNDSAGGSSPDQTPFPTERKSTGTPLIGDLSAADGGVLADVGVRNGLYTWTDGTSVPVGDTTNQGHASGFDRAPSYGVNVAGNPALRFSVAAPTTDLYRLSVWVSTFDAQSTLTAVLPGADNWVMGVTPDNDTAVAGVFTFEFRPDNPGDMITLQWKKTADFGNFDNGSIEAAAISLVPSPSAIALLGLGGLAATRRRR